VKTRSLVKLGTAVSSVLFLAQATAFAAITVLTAPWVPATPTTPHTTYPINSTTGATVIMVATAPSEVGTGDTLSVTWSCNDGSSSTMFTTTNPYDLSTTHQFPATAGTGTQWQCTVDVTDTTVPANGSGSATYYVIQEPNNLSSRVNVAIDWGLAYMHRTMWRGSTTVGMTTVQWGGWDTNGHSCSPVNSQSYDCGPYGVIDAENVQAFEVNGHLQNGPATDPYTDDVYRGINRALSFLAVQTAQSNTYTYNPATLNYNCNDGTQPTTADPTCMAHGGQLFYNASATSCTSPNCKFTFDANSNNQQTYSNDGSGEYTYTTSPFEEMLISAGTPSAKALTGPAGILGQTYQNIITDITDFYNYSQYGSDPYDVSNGYPRGAYAYQGGAWLYGPQQGDDNSTSQWAAIGLIAGFRGAVPSLSVPAIVTDTNNLWITNAQDLQEAAPTGPDSFASSDNEGAYGYRGSWYYSQAWGPFAVTASAMVQMVLDGIGRTNNTAFGNASNAPDQRWNLTETFMADNFCNSPYAYGNGGYNSAYYSLRGYMYGLFSFTKAMLEHDPGFGLQGIQYLRTLTPGVFTGNPSVPTNTIDWYAALSSTADAGYVGNAQGPLGKDACNGVAQTLVEFQNDPPDGMVDGHWFGNTSDVGASGQSAYETAWALIMLKGTVFVACVNNLAGQGTAGNPTVPPRVDLSWTNQANSTSYNVLRSTTSGGTYTLVGNTTSTAFSDTSAGLVNGDTYYYVVDPLNGSTEVCQSNQAIITIPTGAGRH
jgi:hypothetical protein